MNNVIEFLKSKISNEDTAIVACSDEPDSMCLLDIVKSVTNNDVPNVCHLFLNVSNYANKLDNLNCLEIL